MAKISDVYGDKPLAFTQDVNQLYADLVAAWRKGEQTLLRPEVAVLTAPKFWREQINAVIEQRAKTASLLAKPHRAGIPVNPTMETEDGEDQ